MIHVGAFRFDEVWLVDFEFSARPGEHPQPICMVAHELSSGKTIQLFRDELLQLKVPPYSTGAGSLLVAYYSSAEWACHLALEWPLPAAVLDLYVEFRNLANGLDPPAGWGLPGALVYFGLDPMDAVEKDSMRRLALRGGPYTADEKTALLAYCKRDVVALQKLFERMLPELDVPRALLRGRYMKAVACMEHIGVPIDTSMLEQLRDKWDGIQNQLILNIDAGYGVFDGRTFKARRFEQLLASKGIPWRRLESGALALDDDTFRVMERLHPQIGPLRQLRIMLSQMRLSDLAVGPGGRNRTLLSPYRARTGRNQPSNSAFIFGPAVWLRSLIRPEPGKGLAYLDWSQQEFGIAAALSRDAAMRAAYTSGDPYLAFAKQARAAPEDATKGSHGAVREQFKACALAVQYGMEAESLARRIGQSISQARELLHLHRETYKKFWCWSDAAVDYAMLRGRLHTVFGWTIYVGPNTNPRMLRNFPMQGNGAEMLRLACCLATEKGVKVCAPVHDAILIEAPLDELEAAVDQAQAAMTEASELVLSGFRLRSEAKVIRHPERFVDERGKQMWKMVFSIIRDLSASRTWAPGHNEPLQGCNDTCAEVHTRPI
jgi:DNA polymerase-1